MTERPTNTLILRVNFGADVDWSDEITLTITLLFIFVTYLSHSFEANFWKCVVPSRFSWQGF